MKDEKLNKAYQAVDICNEMGVQISDEMRNKVESLEKEYLNSVVLPTVKEQLEELLAGFRTKLLFSASYSLEEGVDLKFVYGEDDSAESDEEEINEEPSDDEVEDHLNYYFQVFDDNYRIVETESDLSVSSDYMYEGKITFPVYDIQAQNYFIRIYEDGSSYNLNVADLGITNVPNVVYHLPWKGKSPIVINIFSNENTLLAVYYLDGGKLWVKIVPVKLLVENGETKATIVSNPNKIVRVGIVPENIREQLRYKIVKGLTYPGFMVSTNNKLICQLLEDNMFDDSWNDFRLESLYPKVDITNTKIESPDKVNRVPERIAPTTIDAGPRLYETKDFYVTFANNKICVGADASDTMVKAIDEMLNYTTIDKLASVGISVDKLPMISPRYISAGRTSFHDLKNGWYVNTHMNNKTKKEKIELLAQRCGIQLSVYLKMSKV